MGALLVWIASFILAMVLPPFSLILYSLRLGLDPFSPEYTVHLTLLAMTDITAVVLEELAILPGHLLTFALVWALVTRFGQLPLMASLGLGWSSGRSVLVSVGLGLALFLAANGIPRLLGLKQPALMEQILNSPGTRFLIAIPSVFSAPFVEELIYRGVLYAALHRVIGVVGAVLLVVAIFTLVHVPYYGLNPRAMAVIGTLSISLTIIRAYTGRLLPSFVLHFVYNGIIYTVFLIEPQLAKVGPSSEPAASAGLLLANLRLSMFGL